METKLKPYPEYKNSGLDWLDNVPTEWEVSRLRYVLHEVDERSADGSETLLSVSQYTGVSPRQTNTDGSVKTRAASLVGYKKAEIGDLVVNIMLAWNGSLGMARQPGIVSPAYGVYRFRADVHPRYAHYLLRTPLYKSRIRASSTGVVESRLRLYTDDLYDLEAVLPPVETQRQIARFLDEYDRRVNRLIRTKQRLIALLNEQKQAIIQRAVTRGLDPDVPLKPSGVDWRGDVPAHWEVVPLSRLERLTSVDSITALQFKENGTDPVYGGNGLRGYTEDYTHEGDYVLIGRQGALCGNVNYAHGKFWASEHAVVATLARGYDLVWFGELVRTMNLNQYSQSAAQPGLSVERIQNIGAPLPPPSEQEAIAAYIREETVDIDVAVERAKEEIDLIREYRTRLIADVVTGKLDVRGVAVPEGEGDGAADDLDVVVDEEPISDEEALAPEEA